MSRSDAGPAKPIAVPGPLAVCVYFALVTAAVLLRLAIKRYRFFPAVLALSFGLQVLVIVGVPTFVLVARWRNRGGKGKPPQENAASNGPALPSLRSVAGGCALAATTWLACGCLREIEVWRASAALEALAFAALALRVAARRSFAGLSARKLGVDALRLACWLAASALLGRRLPRRSADPFVQLAAGASLAMCAGMLLAARGPMRATYQAEADAAFPSTELGTWLGGGAAPALVLLGLLAALALVLRADFGGGGRVGEALWSLALYLDTLACLPQLSLVARSGGVAGEAVSHHLAALFCSRLLGLSFWWLISGTWLGGLSYTGWGIMALYVLQLLLLSHYMGYYFKGFLSRGFGRGVPLVCAGS